MTATRTFAEVSEGVRAALATYAHALDDGRTDDVVATFCADGLIEIPDVGTFEGHDQLRDAYSGWKPRAPQRHLVVNTLITDWTDQEAHATSDVVFILESKGVWSVQFVARYEDTLHRDNATWRFHRRTVS